MEQKNGINKERLIPGHKYLRRRAATYGGRVVEAESWLECVQVTPAGAVFWGENGLERLTSEQIRKEIIREA